MTPWRLKSGYSVHKIAHDVFSVVKVGDQSRKPLPLFMTRQAALMFAARQNSRLKRRRVARLLA